MSKNNETSSKKVTFGYELTKERVSTVCVCCGGEKLKASPAILMPFVSHRIFGWAPVVIDESWGLNTIKNGNAYTLCTSLSCEVCEFLFLDIRFSDDELGRLYQDYRGEAYTALREKYEPGYTLRNNDLDAGVEYIEEVERFLEPLISAPIRMLDWGGDTEKNSPFKSRAEVFDIYDISDKGVIELAAIVSKDKAFSKKYNLIICANVLEHVPYPSELLIDIKKTMNHDSILYIEVPLEEVVRNHGSGAYLKKRHWHEHINFFSEQSLRCLIGNIGLKVVALNTIEAIIAGRSCHLFQIACKLKLD